MDVIVFEKESFYKMIEELTVRIMSQVERNYKQEIWIGENEAKALLGISGRSTLQKLRDNLQIEFSKFGKIIRYNRPSIMTFLEDNRRGLDKI